MRNGQGCSRMLKGELKNNSIKPRELVRKKVLLSPSQGKKKKGDDVAIDEDDDAIRTSVSQDQVIAPLCTKELFLCSVFTALPTYQKLNHEGGRIWTVNTIHSAGPAGFPTSQLDLTTVYKVSNTVRPGLCVYEYIQQSSSGEREHTCAFQTNKCRARECL